MSVCCDAALADSHEHPPERVMEHVKAVKGIDWVTVALRGDFDRLVNYAPGAEVMITGTVEAYYPVAPARLSGEYTIGKTHADGVLPPEQE